MTDAERANRNLHPHAEARFAMTFWGEEYAFRQKGGSMDFWDSRAPTQKRFCIDAVSAIIKAAEENGRAKP